MEVVIKMVVEISTWTEFDAIRNAPSNDYKLVNDLTETDANYSSVANPWDPFPFTGTFDGQGFSVGPITGSPDGLFNSLSSSAVFENVTVDVNISMSQSVAGLSSSIKDGATVRNVELTGSIETSNNDARGLAFSISNTSANDTTVKNCTISASVTSTDFDGRATGLCNDVQNLSTALQNITVEGNITGDDRVAGMAEKITTTDIDNCTVSGIVENTGNTDTFGIAYEIDGSSAITGCSITGEIKSNDSSVSMFDLSGSPSFINIDNCTVTATLNAQGGVAYAVGDGEPIDNQSGLNLTVKDCTFSAELQCQSLVGVFQSINRSGTDEIDVRGNDITIPSTTNISNRIYFISNQQSIPNGAHKIRQNQITVESQLVNNRIEGLADSDPDVTTVLINGNRLDFTADSIRPQESRLFGSFSCGSGLVDIFNNIITANKINGDTQRKVLQTFSADASGNIDVHENLFFADVIENGIEGFIDAQGNTEPSQYDITDNAFITGSQLRIEGSSNDINGLINAQQSGVRARYNYCIHPGLVTGSSARGVRGFGLVNNNATVEDTYTLLGAARVPQQSDSELASVRGFNKTSNSQPFDNCVSTKRPINADVPFDLQSMPLNAFFGDAPNYSSVGEFNNFNIDFGASRWQLVEEGVPVDGFLPLNDAPPILANLDTKAQFEAFSKTQMFDFDFDELKTLTGNVTIDGVNFENAEVYVIDSNRNFLAGPLSTDQNGQVTVDLPGDGYIAYILIDFEDAGQRFARAKSINFDTSA